MSRRFIDIRRLDLPSLLLTLCGLKTFLIPFVTILTLKQSLAKYGELLSYVKVAYLPTFGLRQGYLHLFFYSVRTHLSPRSGSQYSENAIDFSSNSSTTRIYCLSKFISSVSSSLSVAHCHKKYHYFFLW